MIIEIELGEGDIKIIKSAKEAGTEVDNLTLTVIGDIVLSNIKL